MTDSDRWWSDEDIFEEIQRIEEELGKPPTLQDFNEHAEMSEGVIWSHFDSWNDAKEQAGVEAYSHYPSGEKGNPNLTKTGLYRKVKDDSSCKFCDEDFNACLVFHHLPDEEKKFEVSKFRNVAPSVEELQKEIDKCVVLCSNCHRKVHSNDHELSL